MEDLSRVSGAHGSGSAILVADADLDDADALGRLIVRLGIAEEVVLALDGAEALEQLQPPRRPVRLPSAAIVAAGLPKVSGVEVLRRLRSQAGTRSLPVVLVASTGDEARLGEATPGPAGHVQKPITVGKLARALAAAGLPVPRRREPG